MTMTCSVRRDPERPVVDEALVRGGWLRNMARRFRLSPTALFRHLGALLLKAAGVRGEGDQEVELAEADFRAMTTS